MAVLFHRFVTNKATKYSQFICLWSELGFDRVYDGHRSAAELREVIFFDKITTPLLMKEAGKHDIISYKETEYFCVKKMSACCADNLLQTTTISQFTEYGLQFAFVHVVPNDALPMAYDGIAEFDSVRAVFGVYLLYTMFYARPEEARRCQVSSWCGFTLIPRLAAGEGYYPLHHFYAPYTFSLYPYPM